MNIKHPWTYFHPTKRCTKLRVNGEKCGRAVGHCIHHFKSTPFGKPND